MGRQGTSTINYTLTNYAQGFMNRMLVAQAVIAALCPTVNVTGSTGQYKSFDDRNSFTVYNTQRGLGGSAKRMEFAASDGSFNCEPQALEIPVDDDERLRAGADDSLAQELLDQGRIRALLNATKLSHVDKIIQFVLANLNAVGGYGNWSSADIDPIDQLDALIDVMSTDVGSTEGLNLVLSTTAWRLLRNHPKVKARCNGVQVNGITQEQLSNMLIFPTKVVVGALSKTSNKQGQAAVTKANLVGANAVLTYASENPTVYDPSAFKCFTTGTGNVDAVRTYRDESARSDIHAVDWSEDIKQTSTLAAKRIVIS